MSVMQFDNGQDGASAVSKNNPAPVALTGSYVRLSTETMPTTADGVKDGDDLLLVDTKAVYIFYKGTWYQQ